MNSLDEFGLSDEQKLMRRNVARKFDNLSNPVNTQEK